MKRSALGKGIAALIPEGASLRPGTVTEVAIGEIRPNPLQPRRQFAAAGLEELAASIREHGLLQPVLVSRSPAGGYELIAGERRWRASRLAGLERIPVVLRDAVADADQLALALIENLQREDLTPIEEARAYHHLRAELGLAQEAIAARVGKDRSTVANALRLLQLPLPVQEMVDAGELSAGHARALAGVSGAERQEELGRRCAREGWSVRELERRLQPPPRRAARTADPETAAAAERLALALGVTVEINRRRRGGEIRLRFASEEELIRLFRLLAGEKR
jgi:ParB family chromosome partitioning protein